MALILNIETATEICSIALGNDEQLLAIRESDAPYQHTSQITLLIEDCLKEAGVGLEDLDALAVSRGPGSYTALRVGSATAKGICYALNKPMIEVDTLQAIAWGTYQKEQLEAWYCPMIDARRMEVYMAVFDEKIQQVRAPEAVIVDEQTLDSWLEKGGKVVCSGNGAEKCKDLWPDRNVLFSEVRCSALHMLSLAANSFRQQDFVDKAYYTPFYLKPPNITTPKKIW